MTRKKKLITFLIMTLIVLGFMIPFYIFIIINVKEDSTSIITPFSWIFWGMTTLILLMEASITFISPGPEKKEKDKSNSELEDPQHGQVWLNFSSNKLEDSVANRIRFDLKAKVFDTENFNLYEINCCIGDEEDDTIIYTNSMLADKYDYIKVLDKTYIIVDVYMENGLNPYSKLKVKQVMRIV